jgi:type VI protein secretion system component VasF
MKPDANDDQLRRIFAELRQREQGPVPPFARVWEAAAARTGRRPSRVRWAVAACAAAAVVVAVILLHRKSGSDFAAATLLRVSGDDILRTVPSVGASLMRFETLQPAADTP